MKKIVLTLSIILVLYVSWTLLLNLDFIGSAIEGFMAEWNDAGDDAGSEYVARRKNEPETAAEYNDRGAEYQKAGRYGSAAEYYQKAIELDPGSEGALLAYENLENLAKGLREAVESQPADWSQEVFSSGVAHFDKAGASYNTANYTEAKQYLELAIQIFASSRMIDPGNRQAHGFLYISKGFYYYICAIENTKSIKPSDTNYTAMAYLRRACYPFTYAGEYYKLAREYFTNPELIDFVKGYQKLNDNDYKVSVKRFLPQIDYWAAAFMKNVKKDVQCAVTIDRINEALVSGEYEEAIEMMTKFENTLNKMKEGRTGNRNGFLFLNLAYARLAGLLPHYSPDKEWTDEQKAVWTEQLGLCSSDLKRARFEFGTASYANLCDNLMNYVETLENSL